MVEILVFKSQYCPNCQRLTPILKELAEELKDKVKFREVDISLERDIAVSHSILSVPAILIFKKLTAIRPCQG